MKGKKYWKSKLYNPYRQNIKLQIDNDTLYSILIFQNKCSMSFIKHISGEGGSEEISWSNVFAMIFFFLFFSLLCVCKNVNFLLLFFPHFTIRFSFFFLFLFISLQKENWHFHLSCNRDTINNAIEMHFCSSKIKYFRWLWFH